MRRSVLSVAAVALALFLVWVSVNELWRLGDVRGQVTSGGKPVAGVVVRVKTTAIETRTDKDGGFVLGGFPRRSSVTVTAWAEGYYIGGAVARPWAATVAIPLQPVIDGDNSHYSWVPPKIEGRSGFQEAMTGLGLSATARLSFNRLFLPLSAKVQLGCADCHGTAVYDQYAAGAHAQGTRNVRFLTTYNGTDVKGNRSPPTEYAVSRDYGRFPLPPDLSRPWYGPGFKLDFPDQAGNCAACHVPGEALAAPLNTDIGKIPATAVQGTHCDFCHKIEGVRLDPGTGLPYENMPGVLSLEMHRPGGESQLFFGPFDDVDVGPDTYSPLQNDSAVCAPCHNASFWGTPIYQSYAEWLASPYPGEGKTCQSCHMKPDGFANNFAPGRGGLKRDPETVFTHLFPGAADGELLRSTAKLEVAARQDGQRVSVEVNVTNENGDHDLPTDSPLRNVILLVVARDAAGRDLAHAGNQVVPEWGGKGTGPTDYAGRPGKGYAKVLEELWTGVSPSGAYWRQTTIKEDTRIRARAADVTRYGFEFVGDGPITVEARLVFRRAFKELSQQKGWDLLDVEMARREVTVP